MTGVCCEALHSSRVGASSAAATTTQVNVGRAVQQGTGQLPQQMLLRHLLSPSVCVCFCDRINRVCPLLQLRGDHAKMVQQHAPPQVASPGVGRGGSSAARVSSTGRRLRRRACRHIWLQCCAGRVVWKAVDMR